MTHRILQWLLTLLALLALVAAVYFIQQQMAGDTNGGPPGGASADNNSGGQGSTVSVVSVEGAAYQASVSAFGEAAAHYEITLTSQVAGQVARLSDNFENGQQVSKGDLLAELENTSYQADVAAAKATLASSKVDYLTEVREGRQANAEWKASGLRGNPESELVLRAPQLESAKAARNNAEAALDNAQNNLKKTRITAPFNAMITARSIAPGSYVQTGTEVATLYSTDRMEVAIALSARDWNNLPPLQQLRKEAYTATLIGVEGGSEWHGKVLRAEQHLDDETRQRALIIGINQPLEQSPPLLPGTFVKVQVPGRMVDNLWKLPASALSQQGEIWYVDTDKTLNKFTAEPLFSDAGNIYVTVPEALRGRNWQVLSHPLNSYVTGTLANPVEEAEND